ncbi:DUF6538 domain-containing protein [Pseudovibrio ascidiaceicola]|uniref:DUF6538 domain-containing protein n=1 Tax=Pseudovibrio ascidiaceicola TaxID=285279 RepID=UPI003D36CF30
MSGHTRLYRRGATYYHRAIVPADIKDTYPKTEEIRSLGTKDYREALRLVKIEAVKVDNRFDAHRAEIRRANQVKHEELSVEQIRNVGKVYHAYLLEEDEETRVEGFEDEPREAVVITPDQDPNEVLKATGTRKESFEQQEEFNDESREQLKRDYARGKVDDFFMGEVDEVLSWADVNLPLLISSPSRKLVARELQRVTLKAQEAIAQRNQGEIVDTPAIEPLAPVAPPKRSQPLLSEVSAEWADEKARTSWRPKTDKDHRTWMKNFIEVVGDKPLADYTKADARAFKTMLLKLPANWVKQKELAGMKIEKAAKKAAELNMQPMSDLNVNKIIGFVLAFWNWAEANYDETPANLFKGLKIKVKQSARAQRDPFTTEELKAIFSAPLYTGCKSLRYWKEEGDLVPRDSGYYWLPLIGLYTGARSGEIIQLRTADVREQNGIWFFDLVIEEDEEDKTLKTEASRRKIPIHAELVNAGLLDHVERRKQNGDLRLFPDLKKGQDGYYSSPYSKHFRRFLESLGIKRKKSAFHSFRHCFEDACRDSDISKEVMDALQGHTEGGMAGRYGSGFKLEKLAEAMGRLKHGEVDIVISAKKQPC